MATPLLRHSLSAIIANGSVPTKTTDEVDWINPLKNYIRQTYDDPDKFTEECATLQRLRQDTRGAGKDTTGRDLLYRYYGQLELLDLRFPIDENHVRISFVWYDAFSKKPISQYSLAYEKASIIFNIAATLSAIAAGLDRSDADGLKRAFHSLQASAGMFMYINDNFLHAPSTDLSRETVKLLSNIMLAQAQECVCQTQIREGKTGKIVAKLANQAAMLFGAVIEGVNEQISAGVFERVWASLIFVKQKYFLSLAQYHHALADIQAEELGHALSRLTIAESTAREAQKTIAYLGAYTTTLPSDTVSVFSETIKSHLAVIADLKTTSQKDNDFIFHKIIPSESQLPAIGKLSLAKPTSLHDLYKADEVQRIIGGDLFAKLIPMSVTQSASMYSEEKAKIIRAEQEKADVADGELIAALDHLQLPGSLKRFRESKDDVLVELRKPPQVVRDIAREVTAGDRTERTSSLVNRLQQLRTKARDGVQNALRQLDEEERVSEDMRKQFGSDWTQAPSSTINGSLRQELRGHQETLSQAQNNDDLLEAQWMRYRNDIEILGSGEDGLALREEFKSIGTKKSSSPGEGSLLDLADEEGPSGSSARVPELVQTVEKGLGGLNVIKRERQATLKQLKEAAHNDDISSVLILNKKNPNVESQLFSSELEKFRPYQTRLAGLVHKQQDLLSEVVRAFKALLQDQAGSKEQEEIQLAQQQVDSYISRFRAARGGWEDVREGAEKGIHFYNSLNGLLESSLARVNKFISDRRADGASLYKSIQEDKPRREQERLRESLNRLNLNYDKPPPPVPPPPQRTPSIPLSGGYSYPSPPPQAPSAPSYSYSPPPHPQQHAPRGYAPQQPPSAPGYASQQPQSPLYAPPQNPYGYASSPPPPPPPTLSQQHMQYGAPPPQQQYGLPPPLQPKPGQLPNYGAQRPPPPPPPGQGQGQGGYGYRPY